jgi:aminoglycoside N3'-acetyltransferase
MRTTPLTVDELAEDVRRLGVCAGDLLMVHASLRAIGPVDGGAVGVIDALEAAVGPHGSLLMTMGARDDWAWVNERPEAERPSLLAGAEPFDCRSTAVEPEVGVLAEVFRRRPGTVVSDHPEGRFGARGRLAGSLVADVPWDDYYGPGSPLERFVRHGGRVLRLGADLGTVTLYHHAEYLVPLPAKRRVARHRLVATPDGPQVRVVRGLDDSDGIVAWPGQDYFELILAAYLAAGRARRGRVGGAHSELLESADALAHAVTWMAEHLRGHQPATT